MEIERRRAVNRYVLWEDRRVDVGTVSQLDSLLDELTVAASTTLPIAATLHVGDDDALVIVVGGRESHVEYYSATARPPLIGCTGPWDDDQLVAFTFGGQYSEVPRRWTVPVEEAREAMRRFFETGKRPSNINWD